MAIVHMPPAGPTPFEIVLAQRGDLVTVTFLGALTEQAARVLDDVVDRLDRRRRQVSLDLSAAW
jgi:hypothetical protein